MSNHNDTVDDVPIVGHDEARNSFKLFQAAAEGPAFIRRARTVEATFAALLEKAAHQRDTWLPMVRLRLAQLHALIAGDWSRLSPPFAVAAVQPLIRLHDELRPQLRAPVAPTSSARRLRRALDELDESIALFNKRWSAYLSSLDLGPLNALRDGYNRYFVLEKECAVHSPRVAREGFVKLPPLTVAELLTQLPLLPTVFATRDEF